MRYFHAQYPLLNGAIIILTLTAQALMAKFYSAQWLFWILIDVLQIVLWLILANPFQFIYRVFTLWIAIYGFFRWNQDWKGAYHEKICFTGATENFFKVGHEAIEYLARNFPDVELRLALPNTSAIQSVAKNDKVKLFQWNINDAKTLIPAYRGCDAILMVPPIQNRLKVGCEYLRAAISADVQYICCLGVQPINPNLILERV